MIKLCVFDCDGTLVDSQHGIVAGMTAAFAAHGLAEPAAAAVRRVVGLPLADAVARLLGDADDGRAPAIADSYRTAFADLRRRGGLEEPLYPGVLEGLAAIEAAGWLLGMATGKSHRGAIATLAGHGLERRFATVQTPDVALGKPAPDMMLRAMAETGAAPEATVMIGDTSFDMAMAVAAGTFAVGVAWGYHDAAELRAAGADLVVEAFAELPDAVDRLLARRRCSGGGADRGRR
ncbi:MAG: HAD-IA family hydrolase [Rhodospirillales bacterium]